MTETYQQELKSRGVFFEVKNGGNHLVVEGRHGHIDVWPSTGRWKDRTRDMVTGFGLRALLDHMRIPV